MISVLLGVTLVLVAASVMYFAEHDAQPYKSSSISETMWWSVATLTTVGFDDVYPIAGIGKKLTACIIREDILKFLYWWIKRIEVTGKGLGGTDITSPCLEAVNVATLLMNSGYN